MGLVFKEFLDAPSIYTCRGCSAHIANKSDVISRVFQGRLGQAYLVEVVVNGRLGKGEDRLLMTGLHTVCDLYCRCCNALVGWKYVRAHEKPQRYKEGRFVLERSQILDAEQKLLGSPQAPPLSTRSVTPELQQGIDRVLARFMNDVGVQTNEPAVYQ